MPLWTRFPSVVIWTSTLSVRVSLACVTEPVPTIEVSSLPATAATPSGATTGALASALASELAGTPVPVPAIEPCVALSVAEEPERGVTREPEAPRLASEVSAPVTPCSVSVPDALDSELPEFK